MRPKWTHRQVIRKIIFTFVVMFAATGTLSLAGCGGVAMNPFASKKKFVPTPYPADLAIVIDRNTDTYFSRQHVRQIISATDMMSRTTYTNFADYHNHIASQYHVDTPLSQDQLQAMWNAICKHHLLQNAFTWRYWNSPAEYYQRNVMTLQIRANGKEQVYDQYDHWDNNKLPLVLLCESVDLPIGQDVKPDMPPPATQPTTKPTGKSAETKPATTKPSDNISMKKPKTLPATTNK